MKVAEFIGKWLGILTVEAAFIGLIYYDRDNRILVIMMAFLAGTAFEQMRKI